jgi:CRP-like cAMP-binding protein
MESKTGPASRRGIMRKRADPSIDVRGSLLAADATPVRYRANAGLFRQGDSAAWVYYIVEGKVHVSVTSKQGKEGVIALPLGAGDFVGESSLTDQPLYLTSAATVTPAEIIKISRESMRDALKADVLLAEAFTAFLLQHSMDVEAELVDHLFNSSEKRLARTLLLLANFGDEGRLQPIKGVSQELLAQRVGTTRGRISFFMNKFRRLGLIDYNGAIHVRGGLLAVVLHDARLKRDH